MPRAVLTRALLSQTGGCSRLHAHSLARRPIRAPFQGPAESRRQLRASQRHTHKHTHTSGAVGPGQICTSTRVSAYTYTRKRRRDVYKYTCTRIRIVCRHCAYTWTMCTVCIHCSIDAPPQNPTETDPQAPEVIQTRNSAKNENGIFGISASRGFRKVIICLGFGETNLPSFWPTCPPSPDTGVGPPNGGSCTAPTWAWATRIPGEGEGEGEGGVGEGEGSAEAQEGCHGHVRRRATRRHAHECPNTRGAPGVARAHWDRLGISCPGGAVVNGPTPCDAPMHGTRLRLACPLTWVMLLGLRSEPKPRPLNDGPRRLNDGPRRLNDEPRPLNGEPRPLNGDPTPLNGEPKPLNGEPRPVNGDPTPLNGEPRPLNGDPRPLNGEPKPLNGGPRPLNGEPRPLNGEPRPLNGDPTPLNGEPKPLNGEPRPLNGEPRPLNGEPRPLNGEPRPLNGEPTPLNGEPGPLNGEPRPLNGDPTPLNGEPRPLYCGPRPLNGEPLQGLDTRRWPLIVPLPPPSPPLCGSLVAGFVQSANGPAPLLLRPIAAEVLPAVDGLTAGGWRSTMVCSGGLIRADPRRSA